MSEFAEIFDRYRNSGDMDKPSKVETPEGLELKERLKGAMKGSLSAVSGRKVARDPLSSKVRPVTNAIGTRG